MDSGQPPHDTETSGQRDMARDSANSGDDLLQHSDSTGPTMDVDEPTSGPPDLVDSIRGMYRILDLVSEQSSGGLGESSFSVCGQGMRRSYWRSGQNHYQPTIAWPLC